MAPHGYHPGRWVTEGLGANKPLCLDHGLEQQTKSSPEDVATDVKQVTSQESWVTPHESRNGRRLLHVTQLSQMQI